MRNGRITYVSLTLAMVATIGIGSSGCATKGFVRDELTAMRGEMEASEDRMTAAIVDAQNSADEAMVRAELAFGEAGTARDLALGNAGFQEVEQFVVHFDFDSAELTDGARSHLQDAALMARENPGYLVDVYGFTDSQGSAEYNRMLGQKRAEAVLRHMVMQTPGQLSRYAAVSFGEDQPAGDPAMSRRVVVSLVQRVEPGTMEEEISGRLVD